MMMGGLETGTSLLVMGLLLPRSTVRTGGTRSPVARGNSSEAAEGVGKVESWESGVMENGLALLGLGAVWRGFSAAGKKSNMAENFQENSVDILNHTSRKINIRNI
jgi:hypothetical protein